jgi:DNA invertase Pin-like site-specific DNA recombinase
MIYDYARVSTASQDLTGPTPQLKAAGCQKIYLERIANTTATPDCARIDFAILGVAPKLRHRRSKKRTARGRADPKATGVTFGCKPKLNPHQQREATRRRDLDGETLRAMGSGYNVTPQTVLELAP